MADDFNTYTRVDRFEKKRKNTKAISILYIAGGVLAVVLIGLIVFGGNQQEVITNEASNEEETVTEDENNTGLDVGDSQEQPASERDIEEESSEAEELETEELDPSTDDNVTRAYTANWKPVETEIQTYSDFSWEQGAHDWQMLMEAVSVATDLKKDDMIQWRVENGHGQPSDVIATVTNQAQTEVYRVYVSFLDNKGWQTEKVEVLKENDKK